MYLLPQFKKRRKHTKNISCKVMVVKGADSWVFWQNPNPLSITNRLSSEKTSSANKEGN